MWIKSSYSGGNGGECVECVPGHLRTHGVISVRDSKNPRGPVLTIPGTAWRAFLTTFTSDNTEAAHVG